MTHTPVQLGAALGIKYINIFVAKYMNLILSYVSKDYM